MTFVRGTESAGSLERMFSLPEAADVLGLPEATLRFWRSRGTGPRSFRLGPRRVVIAESELVRWVNEQRAAEQPHASS